MTPDLLFYFAKKKNSCTLLLFGFCVISLVQVKDTRVLVATGQANMLERLQESNVFLDDIQKGLNTYLEKKRLYFPRF